MRITLTRQIPGDVEFCDEWNVLALHDQKPQVFYTSEWALAMQAAYRDSLDPLLLVAREDENDEIVGIASLAIDRSGKSITFLAGNTADYCDFVCRPSQRAEFLNKLFAEILHLQPEQVILANFPADSTTAAELENTAEKHGLYSLVRPAYTCARLELGRGKHRAEVKLATSRKKMFQRKMRALERKGRVDIVHLQSWDSIAPALQTYAESHVSHFAATGRVSSLAAPERRCFIENLARRFAGSGVVTLSMLTLNGKPIAWNYGFRFQGSWFWYQPTYDSQWEEYSPGYCLLASIIIDACDMDEIDVIDLGLGEEGYKDRFANSSRQTLHATLSRSWKQHASEVMRYRTATLLKKSPALESAVRSALGR